MHSLLLISVCKNKKKNVSCKKKAKKCLKNEVPPWYTGLEPTEFRDTTTFLDENRQKSNEILV